MDQYYKKCLQNTDDYRESNLKDYSFIQNLMES